MPPPQAVPTAADNPLTPVAVAVAVLAVVVFVLAAFLGRAALTQGETAFTWDNVRSKVSIIH